ncbi:MAG: NADPH-dependent FMN reductase [Planctomycetota bacterium]
MNPSLLAISGSTRKGSWNSRLLAVAAEAARQAGARVEVVDLLADPLPLFSEDLESAGIPPAVSALKQRAIACDGYLFASPEYNGSLSPLMKNTIDWLSRKHGQEAHMAAYKGKVAAVMAASPGALGGLRALPHLRYILEGIGTLVIPETLALGKAHEAFNEAGQLKDPAQLAQATLLGQRLVEVIRKLRG